MVEVKIKMELLICFLKVLGMIIIGLLGTGVFLVFMLLIINVLIDIITEMIWRKKL